MFINVGVESKFFWENYFMLNCLLIILIQKYTLLFKENLLLHIYVTIFKRLITYYFGCGEMLGEKLVVIII